MQFCDKASSVIIESIPLCDKVTKNSTENKCNIPMRTNQCDFDESASSSHLTCKTYQGHVVESLRGKRLYCHTNSIFTNCVLNPCSSHPLPFTKDILLRTQRHQKASVLKNFSKNQLFVLLSLAIGDFISSCSMSIMAPFFPKEVEYNTS